MPFLSKKLIGFSFTSVPRRQFSRRRGGILVLVALAIVGLLGFCALAVDLGRVAVTRNKLQRACDAAALAGAAELPENIVRAKSMAVTTAQQNGVTVNTSDIVISNSNTRIRVPAVTNVGFTFAVVLGQKNSNVYGVAAAQVQQATLIPKVVPVAITTTYYQQYGPGGAGYGQSFQVSFIRHQTENFENDKFMLLDLRQGTSGRSLAKMKQQIAYETADPLAINDTPLSYEDQEVLSGSQGAQETAFADAMGERLTLATGAPWYDDGSLLRRGITPPPDSPRRMLFVVSVPHVTTGTAYATPVWGYAPVYVESMFTIDGRTRMRLRTLPPITRSDGQYSAAPLTNPVSGTRVISLVE